MKAYIPFLLLLSVGVFASIAADAELDRIRQAHEAAMQRATAPIQASYQKELQKLLEKLTKAGKLNEALAVKAEIEKMGGATISSGSSSAQGSNTAAAQGDALRLKLTTGQFLFYYDPPKAKSMTFAEDGRILEGAAEQEKTWKLDGDDLFISNNAGQVSHALRYQRSSDSFKASNRPALFRARNTYLVNAAKAK